MKNYKANTFVLFSFIGIFLSCSVLESELPEFELVGENAIVDEKSAKNALNGAYAFMQFDPLNTSVYQTTFSVDFAVNGAMKAGLLGGGGGTRRTIDEGQRFHAVSETDANLTGF